MKDVEKIPEESENFITEEINANRKCLNGMCPNLWHRYYVSREAKKKTDALAKLYAKGDFHDFAVRVPLAEIESSSNMNQVVFEFRQTTFRKIMDALNDKNASIIGICGMGGVGKTTLLEEISKQAGEKKLFDMLLMVTVSQTPNFKSIQQEIADMIGLQFTEKTPEARAKRLHWRLCEILKEKKLLILVDDVWEMLNLEKKVGIPYGENYKGSKIVLTSRSSDVCNQMGCKPTYQLEGLNDDEAWGLFKGIVGEIVESADRKDIAKRIVGKCGGLPLAMKAVANTLKEKSLSHWEVCISKLKGQNLESVVDKRIDIQDLFKLG